MKNVKRINLSSKKRATAVTTRKEGYSYRAIVDKIGSGVTASGVRKLYERFRETGSIENKHGKGRKKATTPTTDRMMSRQALRNRRMTAKEINSSLKVAQISVSDRTVRRRLVNAGLKARIPRKKPLLNAIQRKKRVEWG
ncbi:uncharacterized protein LOC101241314 [Hydra vulgaris]|uniref:uncharacterized protein LOC101241314 n=1 Tax=Hydra vulgaris TaxID=6087 RepID=UPI001F5E9912|nr:uncharacterized protein LOC101241314 [Hydra vulgaris]